MQNFNDENNLAPILFTFLRIFVNIDPPEQNSAIFGAAFEVWRYSTPYKIPRKVFI